MQLYNQHFTWLLHQVQQQDVNAYQQLLQLTAPAAGKQVYEYCNNREMSYCITIQAYLRIWHFPPLPDSHTPPLRMIGRSLYKAGKYAITTIPLTGYRQAMARLEQTFAYDAAFLREASATDHELVPDAAYLSHLTARQQDIYFLAGARHFRLTSVAKAYQLSPARIQQEYITALTTLYVHYLLDNTLGNQQQV